MRTAAESFTPDWSVHPGELLLDELNERGWSQADLKRQTGFTAKHICRVCKGNAAIGVEFAVSLERALGVSALLWLRMQIAHDLYQYRARMGTRLAVAERQP